MSRGMLGSVKCNSCKPGFIINELDQCEGIPTCNAINVENIITPGVYCVCPSGVLEITDLDYEQGTCKDSCVSGF